MLDSAHKLMNLFQSLCRSRGVCLRRVRALLEVPKQILDPEEEAEELEKEKVGKEKSDGEQRV